MSNNYGQQKNLGLALIIFLTANYLVFIAIGLLKIGPGFLMQVILLLSYRHSPASLPDLFSDPDLYINIIAGLAMIAISLKVAYALLKVSLVASSTAKLVRSIQLTKARGFLKMKHKIASEAFTAGLFRPQIYLYSGLVKRLSAKEFQAVYAHEAYHQQQFDPLKTLLVMFANTALPNFPFKRALFESYEVLSELAADEFAAKTTNGKLPIISALLKMLEGVNYNLALAKFSFKNNRVAILTGSTFFQTKAFFSLLGLAIIVLLINTTLVANTDIFMQCQHLKECFDLILHSNGAVQVYGDSNICTIHTQDVVDHCVSLFRD